MSHLFIAGSGCTRFAFHGVKAYLIHYVQEYGSIICLDQWAHELGLEPWWVRQCAHQAEKEGSLKLTRLPGVVGQPYKVECGQLEER
jgi:hypothetical protein